MEKYAFFIFLVVPVILVILNRLHILTIGKIIKFCCNTALGFGVLYFINMIGFNYGFHIGINLITLLCAGILGLPGCILIFLIRMMF